MASRFVKQPNGLYARWSDVVDCFTRMNMNRAEAEREARTVDGLTSAVARNKVVQADKDEIPPPFNKDVPDGPLKRWRDCLHSLIVLKGEAKAREAETEDQMGRRDTK